MRWAAGFLVATAALAQAPAPPLVRGDLMNCDAASPGQFSVRTAAAQVFRFSFDDKTYFERDLLHSTSDKLQKGDLVEVVSERAVGTSLPYARTVHALDRQRVHLEETRRLHPYHTQRDRVFQMGNLAFAGIVTRVGEGRMVLHVRQGDERTIALMSDTTYVEDGIEVGASDLKTNMRVFVQGATNFRNEIVAYQIMWGQILEPAR